MEKELAWDVNFRQVNIKMSDGSVFAGKVNIRNFARLSDFLRAMDDRFIVILAEAEGEQPQRVMMANKDFILWAEAPD